MWIAESWKEYEVLDTSQGEKLERWGKYILIRPDPQILWNTEKKQPGWKKPNGHYHRSSKGGGEWKFSHLPDEWTIHYKDLQFHLKPFKFKHTGLFPEQAVNWEWIEQKIRQSRRPLRVLNLFAYTAAPPLPQQKPAQPLPMWTLPKAWWAGPGKTPLPPAYPALPFAGLWTTV